MVEAELCQSLSVVAATQTQNVQLRLRRESAVGVEGAARGGGSRRYAACPYVASMFYVRAAHWLD